MLKRISFILLSVIAVILSVTLYSYILKSFL